MKRFNIYLGVLFSLIISVIIVGCVKNDNAPLDQEGLHEVVFHAGWAPETKTVLQEDGSVWWSPGDEISLFTGSDLTGGYKLTSTNTEPTATVNFVGKIGDKPAIISYLAVYPYDTETACYLEGDEDDGFSVVVPSVQVARENGLPEKVFKSFAVSDNENLYFKNLFGGIKFSVQNPDIKSVIIRSIPYYGSGEIGPALSGTIRYNMNGEILSATGSDQITVKAPGNGCFSPDKYYYAVLPARDLENGIVVTYRKESTEASVIYNEGLSISKSKFKRLYKADEGLAFHEFHSTYARFTLWDIIPNSIERSAITEINFYTTTDKTTENVVYHTDPYAETVYYEVNGTVLNYYTKGEVYQVTDGALFSRLINLKSLDLSKLDFSQCTDFGGMFQGCLALKEIKFGDINTSNAKRMVSMFSDCISLESLDLSGFNTSNVQEMSYMFTNCYALKELDLSNFDTHNVISMGEMFECCYYLEKLDISSFTSEKLEYAPGLFNQCLTLLKLNLGSFDISKLSNNYYTCFKMASRSRNCAVLCTPATKEILLSSEAALKGCVDYIQWFNPGETLPDLSINRNPDMYYSTDFSKDKEVKMLNSATAGRGINIVIMGEAYSDRLISDGTYEHDMKAAMEQIFSVEPFKSFKNLFNVYMVTAVSENEIVGENTALRYDRNGWDNPDALERDDIALYEYISQAVGQGELGIYLNKNVTTFIVVNKYSSAGVAMVRGGGGTDDEYYDYPAKLSGVAFAEKSTDSENYRYTVCHEFGHAFAGLHDEYIEKEGEMETWESDTKKYYQSHFGWWSNISFTSNPAQVGWKRFLEAGSGYDESEVSIIEGALYQKGIWKSVDESMMNAGGEFSVPAREAIYKKIHKVAYGEEWQYSFDDFVAWDRNAVPPVSQTTTSNLKDKDIPYPARVNKKHIFKMKESKTSDGRKMITVIMD